MKRMGRKPKRVRLYSPVTIAGAAAIASIYAAGYLNTGSAPSSLEYLEALATTAGAPAVTATERTARVTVSISGPYRDGVFTGKGNSRHGGMEVAVVIEGGKVVSASVTECGTRYPCSDVDPLVRQAMVSQASPVDYVSGATDSSKAYLQALNEALSAARVSP